MSVSYTKHSSIRPCAWARRGLISGGVSMCSLYRNLWAPAWFEQLPFRHHVNEKNKKENLAANMLSSRLAAMHSYCPKLESSSLVSAAVELPRRTDAPIPDLWASAKMLCLHFDSEQCCSIQMLMQNVIYNIPLVTNSNQSNTLQLNYFLGVSNRCCQINPLNKSVPL